MTKALTTFENQNTEQIKGILNRYTRQMVMAFPDKVSPERMLQIYTTVISTNPAIRECSQSSVIGAILQSAILGLDPTPAMGLCAFVPYKKELRFMLQYQGVIELARRSGEISSVTAHVVYENDVFDYEYGMHPNLYHKPVKTDRGDMVYAYAIWKFTNGETQFEVMNRDEIMAAKKASQASGSKYSPWNTEFEGEMWKKTVIKRSSKYVPLSVKTKESFAVDDAIIPAEAFNDDGSLKVEEVKVPEIPDTTKPSVEMPKRKSELPREVTTEEEADAVAGEMLDRIADENKPTHCQICGEKTDNLSMNDNGVWVCEDCFVNNR